MVDVDQLLRQLAERDQQLAERDQQLKAAQDQLADTNLPTYLDGLHKHVYLGLQVQLDKTKSTRGDPANTTNKLRPRKIMRWQSFAREQEKVWELVMESSLVEDKLFDSLSFLETLGKQVRQSRVGSELDLHHFIREAVEIRVSNIIKEMYKDPALREVFALKGSIEFENHANTLSPEHELEEGILNLDLETRPTARRRSPRLAAREESSSRAAAMQPPKTPLPSTVSRPRADQFCVYNMSTQSSETTQRVAAYIKEFKSPHKVTLGHIYGGLEDMDVDQKETKEDRLRRAMAALLTQPFDYMIRAGTRRAVFSTGEADIYLGIGDDPSILLYHLSIPKGDVGETTGWQPSLNSPNRLHLTAVGQALAFTLQALSLRPEAQSWRHRAANSLPKWQVVVADILGSISKEDTPSSDYRPSQFNFNRISPIRLRQKRPQQSLSLCQESQVIDNSDDDHSDSPDTPSRNPQVTRNIRPNETSTAHTSTSTASTGSGSSSQENQRRYCTLGCLRGLISQDKLDKACPNAAEHGVTRHRINSLTFLNLLRRQLHKTINADCESLGIHGSRGALLKVSLSSHGYTVPAKCTIPEFTKYLKHEALVYDRLRPIQGVSVPLYLGSIDLTHPYSYEGICYLTHMMLLSPGGQYLGEVLTDSNRESMAAKTKESLSAMHRLGVLHRDAAVRNLFYNFESQNVVVLDFERAEFIEPRPALGVLSPNRKRRHVSNPRMDKKVETVFTQELNAALCDVQCIDPRFRIL
ncbi:uncharacterized protein N7500_008684 [Penicillium coprophilum]|uniref:uncharacterized protein n=1 Tax=Penicillium coprophilum TaxID=36646 RepID=UPI0023A0EF6D|nr:uncharacterized protein N7500_008684 [Penicillium coprophilum]KAJ5159033.1 hypothetical protein N7500_008684 [Penicillium coprophilum]